MDSDYWKNIEAFGAESFRELMETYGPCVWDYAYSITGRFDLADDVTQDVFLAAYRTISAFRGHSSIRTWLLAITRNMALNCRRAAFVRRVILVGRSYENGKDAHPSAEQEALRRSRSEELWRIVLALPVKFREVLLLDAKYGMSLAEIAGVLDVPLGTVKSRLARARRKVSEAWKGEEAYERA